MRVTENVSAVFQRWMPKKFNDPGMVSIPCIIGDTKIEKAMLDLGASINVLPYSLYKSLGLGPLHETGVVVQLTDRSSVFPKGVVEDVLVMVDNLIFTADFFVLDMENENDKQSSPILLGRPFLKTARTKIDYVSGTLSMEFDGGTVRFNIYDAMKYPVDDHSLCSIDITEPIVQDVFNMSGPDELQSIIENDIDEYHMEYALSTNM